MTTTQYLASGNYKIKYTSIGASAPLTYSLYLLQLSDAVGTYKTSTTSSGPDSTQSSPPPDYKYTGSSITQPSGDEYYF